MHSLSAAHLPVSSPLDVLFCVFPAAGAQSAPAKLSIITVFRAETIQQEILAIFPPHLQPEPFIRKQMFSSSSSAVAELCSVVILNRKK